MNCVICKSELEVEVILTNFSRIFNTSAFLICPKCRIVYKEGE